MRLAGLKMVMLLGVAGCNVSGELAEDVAPLASTGRKIVVLANGGLLWDLPLPPGQGGLVLAVKHVDPSGTFESSNDWEDKTTPELRSAEMGQAREFHFAPGSDDLGYVVADNSIFRVTLGGRGVMAQSVRIMTPERFRSMAEEAAARAGATRPSGTLLFGGAVTHERKPGYLAVVGLVQRTPTHGTTFLFTTLDYGQSWRASWVFGNELGGVNHDETRNSGAIASCPSSDELFILVWKKELRLIRSRDGLVADAAITVDPPVVGWEKIVSRSNGQTYSDFGVSPAKILATPLRPGASSCMVIVYGQLHALNHVISEDRGASWYTHADGVLNLQADSGIEPFKLFASDPTNPLHIVGGSGDSLYETTDAFRTYRRIANGNNHQYHWNGARELAGVGFAYRQTAAAYHQDFDQQPRILSNEQTATAISKDLVGTFCPGRASPCYDVWMRAADVKLSPLNASSCGASCDARPHGDLVCNVTSTGSNYLAFGTGHSLLDTGAAMTGWCQGPTSRLIAADFTGDGRDDLLCSDTASGSNDLAQSTGAGFTLMGNVLPNWCAIPTGRVLAGDVNGDGRADLVCNESVGGSNYLALATANGFQSIGRVLSGWCGNTNPKATRIQLADVDGDGRSDLVCNDAVAGQNYVAQSTGTTFSSLGLRLAGWCGGPSSRWLMADVDGDRDADMICNDSVSGRNFLAKSTGLQFSNVDFTMEPWCGGPSSRLITKDMDGDGRSDLVCNDYLTGKNYLARSNGNGFVTAGVIKDLWCGGSDSRILALDVDGF